MADKTYIVNQESPESITGFESFNSQDVSLMNSFELNTLFNPDKNFVELHVISLIDELLESDYNYRNYKQLGNAQSAGNSGASILTLDPVADVKYYGYENGSVKLLYHFLNDLFSDSKTPTEFFIDSISEDRTELRLLTLQLSADKVQQYVTEVQDKLNNQSYFSEFRLDFKNNDLFIGVNIDTVNIGFEKAVVVKLYEPLPTTYAEKSKLTIVEVVADSVAYEVDYEITEKQPESLSLKPANFNLEVVDDHVVPTGYFTYDELFAYPVNNSNSQIYSIINQKGVELSIDHTDYSNFIHFSSAQERLLNFKYKLDLISSSYANIGIIGSATTGITGVSGSQAYYNGIIEGIINNFDHYERFLYYESGSSSWPKVNSVKPYINQSSTTAESVNWFANQLSIAVGYDVTNYNSVLSAIPSYIKDDANNEAYLTFLYMIGQHFDLLWIYAKAVSDKYNADNRLDYGIPKDLVAEALKNFGIKLYTSNKSIEDLFTTITGQSYQSGSEVIHHYITGSVTGSNTPIQPVSYDSYTKEIQKRIYHNLPLLLKSKGTERGLRALINCFGISSDILQIKQYGGRNVNERPFFGDYSFYTSSLDKVRLDNTGSIVSGSTLSQYTSIINRDEKYTDDLHIVEVGFSPVDNVDNYIKSHVTSSFDIDDYIGDPSDLTLGSYSGLDLVAIAATSGSQVSGSYDLQDYVRLIKFYDNTIFKMVKDFIPARAIADTGIIIKPNLLNRSKAKSVLLSGSRPELSSSIETGFTTASDGGWITDSSVTSYGEYVQTPSGIIYSVKDHSHEEPRFNGELANSSTLVTTGELTSQNPYLQLTYPTELFNVNFYQTPPANICILQNNPTPYLLTQNPQTLNLSNDIFGGIANSTTQYIVGTTTIPGSSYTFSGLTQYQLLGITGSQPTVPGGCIASGSVRYVQCALSLVPNSIPNSVTPQVSYNITSWFTGTSVNTSYQYFIQRGSVTTVLTGDLTNFFFDTNPNISPALNPGELFTVGIQDLYNPIGCIVTTTVLYSGCTLQPRAVSQVPPSQRNYIPNWFIGDNSNTQYYFEYYTNQWNAIFPVANGYPTHDGIVVITNDPVNTPEAWVRIYDSQFPSPPYWAEQPSGTPQQLYSIWNFPTDDPVTLLNDPNYGGSIDLHNMSHAVGAFTSPYDNQQQLLPYQYITHIRFKAVNISYCTAVTDLIQINAIPNVNAWPVTFQVAPSLHMNLHDSHDDAGAPYANPPIPPSDFHVACVYPGPNPLPTITVWVQNGDGINSPFNPNSKDVLYYGLTVYTDATLTTPYSMENPDVMFVALPGDQPQNIANSQFQADPNVGYGYQLAPDYVMYYGRC